MEANAKGQTAESSTPRGGGLAPGTELGEGQYRVRTYLRAGIFAEHYEAAERGTGHAVTIHALRPEWAGSGAIATAVLDSARSLAPIRHPSICGVIAAGEGDPVPFLATEKLDGTPLSEVLARRRQTGSGTFSAPSALGLGAGIFGALAALHEHAIHGALTQAGVLVAADGSILLADLGFAPAVQAVREAGLWPDEAPLAPEVERGDPASAASDLYAAGALLYQIATGRAPTPGCPRPSDVAPGLSREVDELIARCMLADPASRFSSAATVHEALESIAAEAEVPAPASRAAPGPGASLSQSLGEASAPSAADEALAAALADAEERWLVTKAKLDYGPFSTAELVEEIDGDRVLPGHVVIDKTTGERHPVESHPMFCDVADRARQARDDRRRAQAEETHTVRERRRGTALYGLIGSGVVALGVASFLIVSGLRDEEDEGSGDIAALDEEAELEVTAAEVEEPAEGRRAGGGGGGGSGSGGASGLGYDDTRDLDMAEGGGGGERLSNAELNRTIQGHTGELANCLTSTGEGRADIDFIVRGNGRVSDVRVNGETAGPLPSCVSDVMRSMQFPSFDGDRTRGNFDISM